MNSDPENVKATPFVRNNVYDDAATSISLQTSDVKVNSDSIDAELLSSETNLEQCLQLLSQTVG